MIAIVLFIFLAIWIRLTKFAMKIGRHLFRRFRPDNPRAERWGAFWGFMLAMGWVFVFWAVEAVVVRRYAAELCQQAGLKVYITAEQWKNMVGGEEAWKRILPLDRNPSADEKDRVLVYNGKQYKPFWVLNQRVWVYIQYKTKPYTLLADRLYYDNLTNTVLFQYVTVSSGANANDLLGFFIPNRECRDTSSEHLLTSQYFWGI